MLRNRSYFALKLLSVGKKYFILYVFSEMLRGIYRVEKFVRVCNIVIVITSLILYITAEESDHFVMCLCIPIRVLLVRDSPRTHWFETRCYRLILISVSEIRYAFIIIIGTVHNYVALPTY